MYYKTDLWYETDVYILETILYALWNRFTCIMKQIHVNYETDVYVLRNIFICIVK